MDITYTMIGADGRQDGPVAIEQFKGWIAEGRVLPDTKVLRSDVNSWLPAAQYVELGLVSAPPPLPLRAGVGAGPAALAIDPALAGRVQSGARWFYWIAGLSMVNSFMNVTFVAGLAVTLFFRGIGNEIGGAGNVVGIGLSVFVAGIFALLGFFATKGHSWSFIVGMILYGCDALLFLWRGSLLGFGFHIFVLFGLFVGLKANMQLNTAARGAGL